MYTKPGPPYLAEPSLASTLPISRDKFQYTISNHPDESRKDNRPEPSNIEKKTETERTSEVNIDVTTSEPEPMVTTPQSVVLSAESEEQIKRLGEKINNHVDNLEKFKEMATNKLRTALQAPNASNEYEEVYKYLNLSPSFRKRHLLTNIHASPYLTNSVW